MSVRLQQNRIGGEDKDWIRYVSTGASADCDVPKRREVVETLEDDLILARRNAGAASDPRSIRLSSRTICPTLRSPEHRRGLPLVVGHRPLGPSRVFEKVDFDTVDSAPDENGLRLCEPTICLDFECVFDADGSLEAEGAGTPCVKVVVVTAVSPADTVITAPPRPTPPACTTPVMLPTPTVNQCSAWSSPHQDPDRWKSPGSEAVAADADDITRWSTDAFDAQLPKDLVSR